MFEITSQYAFFQSIFLDNKMSVIKAHQEMNEQLLKFRCGNIRKNQKTFFKHYSNILETIL